MGTNYYLQTAKRCECCGQTVDDTEDRHIGKSSAGWCFSLHVYPEEDINTLDDWLPLFNAFPIKDEYDEIVTVSEMLRCIKEREWEGNSTDRAWYHSNYAEPGPNGCARHIILDGHCIGHGDGTWDYIIGEFS